MINELFRPTLEWIRDDWRSHPFRFMVEIVAWAISIGCSITMALTVPNPPLLILYPIWNKSVKDGRRGHKPHIWYLRALSRIWRKIELR